MKFHKNPISFSRDRAKWYENAPSYNAEESF